MTAPQSKKPWIGQSVARLEDPPLVAGRGAFAGDINFPHQLHMRIVRSAHAHGRLVAIDAAAARALPGVFAVWSAADIADVPPIDVILIEEPQPRAPYGIKGVGEIGLVPTAGAVAAALHDLDGVWRAQLPMRRTP